MKRVTGIGGVFFKARDPKALADWYRKHLGIDVADWGGTTFQWNDPDGATVWSLFPADSKYYPGPFMVNYRVEDLEGLIAVLREEGCDVAEKTESHEHGRFGWVTDPEGNRIELWQPPAGKYDG